MKYTKTVLSNGLRIITVPMKDNPTATVLVLVEAGSKYENDRNAGVSHFLEHMCFKGTKNRPTALRISEELDEMGAAYNAFTAQEYTGYYAKARAEKFGEILDVVSDMYLNPIFEHKEIEKEKGVITEEIKMYEEIPQARVHDMFMELLYKGQPAGRNIAGTKETVAAMKREDFLDYREKHYVASATLVVVAGNVDEKKAIEEVKKKFAGISAGAKEGKEPVVEKQKAPAVIVKKKEVDQTQIILGVRSRGLFDPDDTVFDVMAAILGGGMSSRFFHKLRNEMGAVYSVQAFNDAYTDSGYFAVAAGVDGKRAGEVMKVVIEELNKIKNIKVPEAELRRVKEHMIGGLYLGLESSDSLAQFYGGQEIIRRPIKKPDEIVAEIQEVTAEDIKNAANEIIKEETLNLAAIGNIGDGEDFKKLLKFS